MPVMPTVFSSLPGGVPAMNWPANNTGYKLITGKRYVKLAAVDYCHGGLSLLCFVDPGAEGPEGDQYFRGDGWSKRGRALRAEESAPFVPLVAAARAAEAGTGPATWCEPYTREGPDLGEVAVSYRYASGWSPGEVTVLDVGQHVVRYTHPSGAIVDDNTGNVPEDMADVPAADLAETAYTGHRPDGAWEQWPSREHAQAYALGFIEAAAALRLV